jgi:hypothetical protein
VGKAFSPWGGGGANAATPREALHPCEKNAPTGQSRVIIRLVEQTRRLPSRVSWISWGDKRSIKLAGQNTLKIPPQGTGKQFRREADFYSWGGER